jgi:hypothetical protein
MAGPGGSGYLLQHERDSISSVLCGLLLGADAIIALRCREASSQQETICMRPRTQTGAA